MNQFVIKSSDYVNPNLIYKKIVHELDLSIIKPPRAGIIMYTKINNEFYFGLGIDNASKEITDFGGGISYKERDKNVILGALREFKEETLNILPLNYVDVIDSPVIYNNNNLIIFKYVEDDPDLLRHWFLDAYRQSIDIPEVCDIIWMNTNELKQCIMTRGKMFFRVQNFLQKSGNFYWLL